MRMARTMVELGTVLLLMGGCIQPKAISPASPEAGSTGSQSGGAGSFNIGAVAAGGGVTVCLCAVALVWLVTRYQERGGALRLLAEENQDRPETWKQCVQRKAVERGVERELRRAVKKVDHGRTES